MKKLLLVLCVLFSTFVFAQTSVYPGNGKNSFGGPVGQGNLSITDNGTSLTFTLTKGPGNLNDIVVFYVDITAGFGLTSTAGLNRVATKYERAVSTKRGNNTDSSVLIFPADFAPDAALAFDKDGGKTYFFPPAFLQQGTMVDGNDPQVTPTGTATSPTYSQTISKANLNLSNGPITFKFFGTYISESAYRSNESFGDNFAGYRLLQPAADVAWNPYTVTGYFTYSSTTLPVKVVDLKAVKNKEGVQVNWTVANESNIDEYEVQRSLNGTQFSTIGTIKAKNSAATSTYSYTDANATKGTNYYRLSVVEKGKKELSKVVSIKNTVDKNSFIATALGNAITVKLTGIEAGTYRLSVMNTSGQMLQSLTIQHDGADVTKQVDMKGSISKGVYRVTLQGENAQFIKSILVQ